ncbi:MAG TPA: penicillin-binding protein activator LpoB [Candidatus Krumholzibacteria bacterium]|nr:penicillin-binding protein activator LpoB [Candidatus Krumholzibacteria bacterium]
MISRKILCVAVLAAAVMGCSGGKEVTRIDPGETVDLSGRWNDTDSRLVSEEMIADCMSRPWKGNHVQATGKRPIVIVGTVRNKSSEHIAVGTFIGDIERAFINSGEAEVVASAEEREQIRDERGDQQQYSSEETMKSWGREHGADYMLSGVINSIEDQEGGNMVVFYQIDLNLIDLEKNTKVWQGQKKIKKFISNSGHKL